MSTTEMDPPPYWGLRMSQDGIGENGFYWAAVGQWTIAPDWDPQPRCGGGLHSQGPGGWGVTTQGTRAELIEYAAPPVVVEGTKLKGPRARIVAIDTEAWALAWRWTEGRWPGSIDLRDYPHQLPAGLRYVGGSLILGGYPYPLPAELTYVGGDLTLGTHPYPLPAGLQYVGGCLNIPDYAYPLPAGLRPGA